MPTVTHEQTINTALAEVLERFGRRWQIRAENIGGVFHGGGRPDILIEKADGWPIVIEAEVANQAQAEKEAQSRLHRTLVSTGRQVHASVALVYPKSTRSYHGEGLRGALTTTQFEYVLYSVDLDGSHIRFPESGWISGDISELALLLHRSAMPAWRVESLTDTLESGVIGASGLLSSSHPPESPLGTELAEILGQSDDPEGQTRRMAMTILIDALVFHAALAEAGMTLPTEPPRTVRSPSFFRSHGRFLPSRLIDEWNLILKVNYWPIFHTSRSMLHVLPPKLGADLLGRLWETAEELIVEGVTRSHDLTGAVFQRLIADRKFLATFYTRPAAAALLAGLALPLRGSHAASDWADIDTVASLRIGDFACGTGTLLSTAYQRLGLLHEISGGDPAALHPTMMARGLVGLDVLTVAVHLTAAMLAGSHPQTPFEGECLLTMPYGRYDWGVSVGSLDLLSAQMSFEILQAAAETAGGRSPEEVKDLMERVGHNQFDLVIMNPPFTRHGAREGDRTLVHNPAFAAFGADDREQDLLSGHLRQLSKEGPAHGHAGLASYFVDLADRKTASGGRLALVLPLTAMSGQSWEKVRAMWRTKYHQPVVITIAQGGTHSRSFSADTGMAECLFVASKRAPTSNSPRATFVILSDQPTDTISAEQIADTVTRIMPDDAVRTLEGGPYGGTRIVVGNTTYGEVVDCPLPVRGAWQITGIKDISLAQTAHQLANGRLWIEGMPPKEVAELPIASIHDVVRDMGPHHLDITGSAVKADGLPQGPFEKIAGCPDGAAYPSLWNHKAVRERRLVVYPDSHCRVREIEGRVPETLASRAAHRWSTAGRVHYNLDLRFNSQSLAVGFTDPPSLGGRAWPTVLFHDPSHEYLFALWCNSTLGLLCHWWMANKTQAGRGTSTITSVPTFPTLDLRRFSQQKHSVAESYFARLRKRRFLPFDQIDEDPVRQELDRNLVEEVLELPSHLCDRGGPIERLRVKIAVHPARSSPSAPPGSALQPAPKKIPLDRKLSDLGVQVVDLRLMLLGELPAPALGEHLRHAVEQLPLPGTHLVRMKLMPRGDRLHAVALLKRFQRHTALELRREPSSLPGHLGASCSIMESTLTTCPKNRDHLTRCVPLLVEKHEATFELKSRSETSLRRRAC